MNWGIDVLVLVRYRSEVHPALLFTIDKTMQMLMHEMNEMTVL